MKSILVTGANRTGTTWVGEMLTFSRRTHWLYEPFNWQLASPRIAGPCPFPTHFHAVTDRDQATAEKYLRRRIIASLSFVSGFGRADKGRVAALLRSVRAGPGCLTGRKQVLIKDPTALMSAEWIADRFDSRVVVIIRHPAAYVASVRRVDWPMNPETLLDQPAVMNRLPGNMTAEARRYVESREKQPGFNLIDTAWFWKLLYAEVDRLRSEHPDWIFVRHEDLSLDYMNGFRELYSQLGLPWSSEAEESIGSHCNRGNTSDPGSEIMVLKRDSRSTVTRWKTSLESSEIAAIRDITGEVATRFYEDEWWSPEQ